MGMTYARPELELKRRAPLAGGQSGAHEFVRAVTVIVGFSDTCDFICDGTADDVEINAAIVYVGSLGAGYVHLERGIFSIIAAIVNSGVQGMFMIIGEGKGITILNQVTNGQRVISFLGDPVAVPHWREIIIEKITLQGSNSECLYIEYFDEIVLRDVEADGGSVGFRFYNTNGVRLDACLAWECSSHGMQLVATADFKIYASVSTGNGAAGIYASGSVVKSALNEYTNNGAHGADVYNSPNCHFVNDIFYHNTNAGISFYVDSADAGNGGEVIGCQIQENNVGAAWGAVRIDGTARIAYVRVVSNRIFITSTGGWGVLLLGGSTLSSIVGNTIVGNAGGGIQLNAVSNNIVEANIIEDNSDDGIDVTGDADDNQIQDNYSTSNGEYGVRISADTCDRTIVKDNYLLGNTLGCINDGGTDTKLLTKTFPFMEGTTMLSADAGPWGWEIDAADEYALTLGQLPLEVQQVVRWKIWAVTLDTDANSMRLEILGFGGASDEAYTTETVAIVNHPSTTINFAANDVIYWVCDAGDDTDIGDMLGGDLVIIKVKHEVAGNGDVETDAVFTAVEIEYV